MSPTNTPVLPPGYVIDLPGRGHTFARVAKGPPGASTVLLLHGWTATADLNWFRCYEPLARHYNVVAMDLRGHGRGIRSRRPFSFGACADDAAALVRHLGYRSVIPVGYSMGGPVAQLLWRSHRPLVRGLVLCATSRNFGRSLPQQAMFTGMLGLSGFARMVPRPVLRQMTDQFVPRRLDQTPLGEWAAAEMRRHDPSGVLEAGWALGRFSSADWIGEVDVPTSVLVTTRDSVVTPHRQLRLAQAIPGAEVVEVAGDHGVCVGDPGRFVPGLLDACRRVDRRAGA